MGKRGSLMEGKCPACRISVSPNHKFCPACGAPLAKIPEQKKDSENKDRRFILREGKYGDTEMYDHSFESEKKSPRKPKKPVKQEETVKHEETVKQKEPDKKAEPEGSSRVSLYLSLAALVLSVAAVVLVLIFSVFPSVNNTASDTSSSTDMEEQTEAPTVAPTEPPIAGTYKVSEWNGDDSNIATKMLKTSTLEMKSDYTGKLFVSGMEFGDVTLEKESDKAIFMETDCSYAFDGTNLTIDYMGMTLLFKKQ